MRATGLPDRTVGPSPQPQPGTAQPSRATASDPAARTRTFSSRGHVTFGEWSRASFEGSPCATGLLGRPHSPSPVLHCPFYHPPNSWNAPNASQDSSDMSRSRSRSHSLRAAVFVGGVNKRTFARHVALGWRVRGIVRYCAILCDIMR